MVVLWLISCMTARQVILLLSLLLVAGPAVRKAAEDAPGACDSGNYEGPSVAAIVGWASESGIRSSHFAVDGHQHSKGIVAQHEIPPKSTLVSMTRSMSLSMVLGRKSPFPDLVPEDVWSLLGENRQLGLILLNEARQGPKSKFHIWIESLPREVPTLLHWTDKELQQLQLDSTSIEKELLAQVRQQQVDTEQEYDRLQNTPLATTLDLTLEDLTWAADMATSRSFGIPKQLAWFSPLNLGTVAVVASIIFKAPLVNRWQYAKQVSGGCRIGFMLSMGAAFLQSRASSESGLELALLPLMDLLNHNSSNLGDLQASHFSSSLKLVSGPHAFEPGQEVTHSYGDKPNEALLQFYGFVEKDNVHDVYMANLWDWVQDHHSIEEERWRFLETDPLVTQALKKAELRQQGWSDMIIESLRYLLASQQEIDERQLLDPGQYAKNLYKYRELPHIMTPWKQEVSEIVEQNVFKVLHGFCSEILALKPTTFEADKQELQQLSSTDGGSDRQRLALQFRIAKKSLLKSCVWQYDPSQMAP